MTERLDEHKMKYAVDTDKEAEDICRWAAARAGVIVVAPVVGTMTLMANEVYMITRLAKLRGIKLSESAVLGLLGSLGGAFVGQTLATLIPFAPVQIPVGMSVTYAVARWRMPGWQQVARRICRPLSLPMRRHALKASKCWAN